VFGIIPLAGPDFYLERPGCCKPMLDLEGRPLIQQVLSSRSWINSGELPSDKLIFVLRETKHTAEFREYLMDAFPHSRQVTISVLSGGALLSAVAGCSLINDFTEPLAIDLVDILYRLDVPVSPTELFAADPQLGGLLPVFDSAHPQYSYARLDPGDPQGTIVAQTAEKQVISHNASAGTYFFRNTGLLLAAVGHALRSPEKCMCRNSVFVCPVYNSVIADGWKVRIIRTQLELSISLMVKTGDWG